MTDFKATMESGTVWQYRDGILKIFLSRGRGTYVFKPWAMKVVDREKDFGADVDTWEGFWNVVRNLPTSDVPEVGKSLYAGGREEWRLSTKVVSVEILEPKDNGHED